MWSLYIYKENFKKSVIIDLVSMINFSVLLLFCLMFSCLDLIAFLGWDFEVEVPRKRSVLQWDNDL